MSSKQEIALQLLDRSWLTVHLRTDVPEPELVIPKWLRQQKTVALQYGYSMPRPIPDLLVNGTGISGTLSFGGIGFHCTVPWSAVYAMAGLDGRGEIWPDEAPGAEVRKKLSLVKGGAKRTTPAIGVLRLVQQ